MYILQVRSSSMSSILTTVLLRNIVCLLILVSMGLRRYFNVVFNNNFNMGNRVVLSCMFVSSTVYLLTQGYTAALDLLTNCRMSWLLVDS